MPRCLPRGCSSLGAARSDLKLAGGADALPALFNSKKRTGAMVGQVLQKITVDVDASPALDALESFASARPSRGMRRKWARACAAIRARRQGWYQTEWNGTAVSVHLNRDLLPLMVEAHLRAAWLRGAV